MFLRQQHHLVVGIYFIAVTLRSVYPVLLINCSEGQQYACEKGILKSKNTCSNKSPMEFLKTFYEGNEYTFERNHETAKEIYTQSNKECSAVDSANDINWSYEYIPSFNEIISPKTGQKIQFSNPDTDSDYIYNVDGLEILRSNLNNCGVTPLVATGNITEFMEYPWTVLLLYNTDYLQCGGSLITKKYVLTAAHCAQLKYYELTGVRLGEYDLSKEKDCGINSKGNEVCFTTVDAKVIKTIVHHDYSQHHYINDIALLKLDQDYYSESYYPICIPSPDTMHTKSKAIVAGWGLTEKGSKSNILRKAEVPLLHMSKCRSVYPQRVFNETREICAAGINQIGTCKGDSGGALFYNENMGGYNKYYQLGVISVGARTCGETRFMPQIFTKLTGFYTWIGNNLEY